ncbi:MAG: class I SAM-dependent methyltransferase [Spirochaetes bacterium]|nr:class I SAM-dependent methyltransferase [Spirochaetota bacterium]
MSKLYNYDIFHYIPTEQDLSITNPYLREILQYSNQHLDEYQYWNLRHELIKKYAFAVPTYRLLSILKELSPIIEIGAGNGYWAYMLTQVGADVIAYDKYPPEDPLYPFVHHSNNIWFEEQWFDVNKGDANVALEYPERSLFLCWPEPQSSMAFEALQAYKKAGGHTIIFIGDMIACAENSFYDLLSGCTVKFQEQVWGYKYFNEFIAIYSL